MVSKTMKIRHAGAQRKENREPVQYSDVYFLAVAGSVSTTLPYVRRPTIHKIFSTANVSPLINIVYPPKPCVPPPRAPTDMNSLRKGEYPSRNRNVSIMK